MWSVKSEAGTLKSVLVHDASYIQYELNPIFTHRLQDKHVQYERSRPQLLKLYEFMREEGVKVLELGEIIKGIVESADTQEKQEIIDKIWEGETQKPNPE